MILDLGSRDDGDVMINKYLIIILITLDIDKYYCDYMSYATMLYYYMLI
jgi:hypothetical protein